MEGLTAKQSQCLSAIRDHLVRHGIAPPIRELAGVLGIRSANGVKDHLYALEHKGFLVFHGRNTSAIRLTDKVPTLARVSARRHERLARAPRTTVVYFAQSLDTLLVKIGWTNALSSRARSIRHAGDVVTLVTIPGARKTERAMHNRFASSRVMGEWFRADPPLVQCIAELRGLSTGAEKRIFLSLPERPEGTRLKHCSLCGAAGHNATTCPQHAVAHGSSF